MSKPEEKAPDERTTIETSVNDFLEYHAMNKSSVYTINSYQTTLVPFAAWLHGVQGVRYVDQIQVKVLRLYIRHIQTTPNAKGAMLEDTTVHQYAVRIIAYCHWVENEGLLQKGTVSNFKLPKAEEKKIPALTHEEFLKLLEACEANSGYGQRVNKALTSRNRAIVSVLFDAGIRRSELVGLRLGDIDRNARLLYVRRKGGKWQQVPLSRDGFKPLHDYITKHRPSLASIGVGAGSKKDDPVFLSQRGEGLKCSGISELFKHIRKRTDIIDKPVYSHQGRRYMATTQLDAGRNPLDVQRQMGHTSLNMTNRYYSQTTNGLSKSHEMYSPTRKRDADIASSGLGSGYHEG